MSPLPSRDSQLSENSITALPADAFDSQTAKAGLKKFAALWPLLPPVALFGIAFSFSGAPLPTPIGNNGGASPSIISASQWIVPASETMVVVKQPAAGYALLRGRLRAPQGEIVAAPSRGQVARVMARVGQSVKAGDPLVLISRGTIDAPRSTSPLERWQLQAEDAQIAAAKQQESLAGRMSGANERLQNAQARVAQAQTRVAEARALIKRLQNGEEIQRDKTDAAKPETPAPRPAARAPQNEKRIAQARAEATRESQQLQKTADAAEAKSKAARSEARAASAEVDEKQSQLKAATSALAAAKSVKPAKTTDGDDTGNAASGAVPRPSTPDTRSDTKSETKAVAAARDALAAATSRAAAANREAARQQAHASELRGNANAAARRAMQKLQVFEEENAAENPPAKIARESAPRGNASGNEKVTVGDAVRIARQAMKESDEAIAEADRIRREVKSYERPVSGTKRRVDDATKRLQSAQEQIWNTAGTSRPTLTQVAASASGTLVWVAEVTREVSAGETIATIGRRLDRLEVSVQDSSGAWKSLTPGARVLALVKTTASQSGNVAPALNSQDKSTPALARSTSATAITPSSSNLNGTPSLARVIAIAPPTKAGAPATIRIAVHNPPQTGGANQNGTSPRAFTAGMGVFFSLPRPGKLVMIRVPAASIRRDENGKTMVAVLAPLTDAEGNQPASNCRVEWREVRVGNGDGFNNQILTGLKPGERVALRPDALYNFTLAYGAEATVRVEQT